MKTTTYTKEQVIDFINAQPDERAINFDECNKRAGETTCGCLLVHLAEYSFGDLVAKSDEIFAGFDHVSVYRTDSEEKQIASVSTPKINLGPFEKNPHVTYGQLKQNLDQLFTE